MGIIDSFRIGFGKDYRFVRELVAQNRGKAYFEGLLSLRDLASELHVIVAQIEDATTNANSAATTARMTAEGTQGLMASLSESARSTEDSIQTLNGTLARLECGSAATLELLEELRKIAKSAAQETVSAGSTRSGLSKDDLDAIEAGVRRAVTPRAHERDRQREQASLQMLQHELDALKLDHQKLEQVNAHKDGEIRALEEQLRAQNEDNERLRQDNHSLQGQITQLRSHIVQQDVEIRAANELADERKQQIAAAEEQHSAISTFAADLARILGPYPKSVHKLQDQNDAVRNALRSLREALELEPESARLEQDPFALTRNQDFFLYGAGDATNAVQRFLDTQSFEDYFADVSEDNIYKKMYQRFSRQMARQVAKLDVEEDSVDDVLPALLRVVQDGLLKKIVIALYRAMKNGTASDADHRLLDTVNTYLESAGLYTRSDSHNGDMVTDKDYKDMELITVEAGPDDTPGQILEIELYPYYVNYRDEDGDEQKTYTQGSMITAKGSRR